MNQATGRGPNIIGISAFYHEASACLLKGGTLVAAAAEERFSRVKHDPRLPVNAFRYCLEAGSLGPTDIDAVAFYESPPKKLDRQRASGVEVDDTHADRPERMIREYLGFEGPIMFFDHHLSHAASTFFFSGFEEAAILTVDGVGEWATTTYGHGRGGSIDLFEEVRFPHSLGLLYATITSYLGFGVNRGEYKVMGLAPYGEPRFTSELRDLVQSGRGGQYRLDMRYFDFVAGDTMYSKLLAELLRVPPRHNLAPIERVHADLARSAQMVLEELLLEKAEYLAGRVASPNLCLAGGVALNSVANGRIRREGPFARLFVPPSPGDAGASLGAAALAHIALTGQRHTHEPLLRADFGPGVSGERVERLLRSTGLGYTDHRGRPDQLIEDVAGRLQRGQVVGWFQGRSEFGPRALGHRSILANPRDPAMTGRVNSIKQREAFRPLAPSVLEAQASVHFDLNEPAPFMVETCTVTTPFLLPAVTHVDGSARPQTVSSATNPRYAALLQEFQRLTDCPVLLNTSLNVAGEPMANSPVDALMCLGSAGLSALVLGDAVIDAAEIPASWPSLLQQWDRAPRSAFAGDGRPDHLYTFV